METTTTQESQTVRASVNHREFFKSMRHLFASSFSVMGELVQNGRRAQATRIGITCDASARTITVSDDGIGIQDFDALLDLATSGWQSSEVQLSERPFGMGFFSCAFAAETVNVYSKGKFLQIRQEDVIEQRALMVREQTAQQREAMAGWSTRIELVGVNNDVLGSAKDPERLQHEFRNRLERLVRAFALPVTLNDDALKQDHSLHALKEQATLSEVGHVYVPALHKQDDSVIDLVPPRSSNVQMYLQGLPIGTSQVHTYGTLQNTYIVHLDSAQFVARMPDRSHLFDEQKQIARIEAAIKQIVRDRIARLKESLSPEQFVLAAWRVAHDFDVAHLFNDVPFMPRDKTYYVDNVALNTDYTDVLVVPWTQLHNTAQSLITYEDVKSGRVKIWRDAPSCVSDEPWAAVALKVMQAKGILTVHHNLSKDHWVNRITPSLNDLIWEVQVEQPGTKFVNYCWESNNARVRQAAWADVIVTSQVDPTIREVHRIENNWLLVPDDETLEAHKDPGSFDVNYDCWLLGDENQANDHPVNCLATFTDDSGRHVEEYEDDAKQDWDIKVSVLRDSHLSATVTRLITDDHPYIGPHNLEQIALTRVTQISIGQGDDKRYGSPRLEVRALDEELLQEICTHLMRRSGVELTLEQLGDAIWHAARPGEMHGGPFDGAFRKSGAIVMPEQTENQGDN